jgi:hypothetical protein
MRLRLLHVLSVTCGLGVLAVMFVPWVAQAELPAGWLADGMLDRYQLYRDGGGWNGYPMVVVRATKAADTSSWAWAYSTFRADRYRGVRVRYSAMVKTDVGEGWAGVWIQTEHGLQPTPRPAVERLAGQVPSGVAPWRRYAMVVDVPSNADTITFGCLVSGRGTVVCADASIQEVDREVPLTHGPFPWFRAEPQLNLSL